MKKRILIASFLFIILIIMIILTIKKNHRTVESNESISNDCTISIEDNSFNYNDDIYLKDIVNQECNLISNEKLNTSYSSVKQEMIMSHCLNVKIK